MRAYVRSSSLLLICIASSVSFGQTPTEPSSTEPVVNIDAPFIARIGEPFQLEVTLSPPPNRDVLVEMRRDSNISYSPQSFKLKASQGRVVTASVKRSSSGLVYVFALAEGYERGWNVIVVGFDGHLKLNSMPTLSYDVPTTLSLSVRDSNDKPILFEGECLLELGSSDGTLSSGVVKGQNVLWVNLPPGSRNSPQFQIQPRLYRGGAVHLSGKLTVRDTVIAQDEFSLSSEPVWWLPPVLALIGGLVHGIYKILRFPTTDKSRAAYRIAGALAASCVAGITGYLFANLDLLGLKLDPNVLRTYPLVGFLFSYFGFEILLPKTLRDRSAHT